MGEILNLIESVSGGFPSYFSQDKSGLFHLITFYGICGKFYAACFDPDQML